jgi:hypothetical protein
MKGDYTVPGEGKFVTPVERVRERLNRDPEWAIAARYWSGRVRFFANEDEYFMEVQEGRVVSFIAGTDGYQSSTRHLLGW